MNTQNKRYWLVEAGSRICRIKVFGFIIFYQLLVTSPLYAETFNPKEWPKTNFRKHNINLNDVMSGGPPKDGIPAIDNPIIVNQHIADIWLKPTEPVIVVSVRGVARAYPIQILIYHEIVNDSLNGIPISVTFCPLCNAAIVFKRKIGERVLDFGTTGRLRKSDMLMYDRQTESWWQQFLGEGVIGHYTDAILEQLPAAMVSFQTFKKDYPLGTVLSKNTGYSRPYGNNPYQGYDDIKQTPFLFFDPLDPRLPAMERIIGLIHKGKSKVYPFSALRDQKIIHDRFLELAVVVFAAEKMNSALDASNISQSRLIQGAAIYSPILDGRTLNFSLINGKITDDQTGSHWSILGNAVSGKLKGKRLKPLDSGVHFAFAWLSFRPESIVYKKL